MLYFPQLSSGAMAQYPFLKRRVHRTAANTLPDGSMLKIGDGGAGRVEWELSSIALSEQERAELEGFFGAVEGRFGQFTFLDPTDNLLVWSENFEAPAWSKGPALTIESGRADALGGAGAARLTNSGAAVQALQQTLNVPGWFHYSLSLYARSDAGNLFSVFRSAGGNVEDRPFPVRVQWSRVVLSGRSETSAESVTFGIALSPGTVVEICGVQAEAQIAPSAYRRTMSRGGVYPHARFDVDSISVVSEGPEQHRCAVRVVAAME